MLIPAALTDLSKARAARRAPALWINLDQRLLTVLGAILGLGLVMVASASVSLSDHQFGQPFHYLERQLAAAVGGVLVGTVVLRIPLESWKRAGSLLLGLAYLLLIVVLIPGVGRQINGSIRWIPLGLFNLQVSEVAKMLIFIYLAGYLVRRSDEVRGSMSGFLVPIAVLSVGAVFLLAEPDFGAAAVMMATGLGMLFVARVPLWRFAALVLMFVLAGALLIVASPYRWHRLTGFLNPWADPFNSGFQLTQSLIAIGRGEWFGVGLGASVQKMFYLPEAHTDFLFAVLAEELGLAGVVTVIALYGYVVWRAFRIGIGSLRANRPFGAYLAYAVGIWIGLQAFINMGVNMGLLPTKGLTLPLMSYGGSSLLATCVAFALLLRADHELRIAGVAARSTRRSS